MLCWDGWHEEEPTVKLKSKAGTDKQVLCACSVCIHNTGLCTVLKLFGLSLCECSHQLKKVILFLCSFLLRIMGGGFQSILITCPAHNSDLATYSGHKSISCTTVSTICHGAVKVHLPPPLYHNTLRLFIISKVLLDVMLAWLQGERPVGTLVWHC